MTTKTRKTRSKSSLDDATAYAKAVVDGELITGPDIRNACKRHLDDLENGHERGLTFDVAKSTRALDFFRKVLKLNGGKYEGKPFEPLPWQCFIIGSLFGWMGPDGKRRYREAYIETGKGSGKSPLAAGIGIYGLVSDGEHRAEIYAAATKKDQAMILFRDAVAMVKQSPALAQRIEMSGGAGKEWNLAYLQTGSFFRPISSDDGQSGPRPHIGLIDEYHEHKTSNMLEMLVAGSKSREQALFVTITNSGTNKNSPCWQRHEYGAKIAEGTLQNDAFFAFICSLDEDDDPMDDESCWYKSNPSLQGYDLPGMKYLREQTNAARGMPAKESIVRRLNFCQWTGAESPWISTEIWKQLAQAYDLDDLIGRRAYAGLDLSSTTDLTGLVLLVEPIEVGEKWKILAFPFLPDGNLDEKEKTDAVPYLQWKAMGHLNTTPGAAVSKRIVAQFLSAMCEKFEIVACAYDRWRIEDFKQIAADEGIALPEMVAFGQGYKDMSPAVEKFETMILNGEIAHNSHPIMNWCIGNAVTEEDAAGNRKLTKAKATGRMDLTVAAVMAVGIINTDDAMDMDAFFDNPIMVGV